MPTTPWFIELAGPECLEILRRARIGRVGLSIEALPAIFPVFIAVVDDVVVFPALAGSSLASGSVGSILAVQTDTFDAEEELGSSVLARGYAEMVTDDRRARCARKRLHPTWAENPRTQLIQVTPTLLTGRRFGPAPIS